MDPSWTPCVLCRRQRSDPKCYQVHVSFQESSLPETTSGYVEYSRFVEENRRPFGDCLPTSMLEDMILISSGTVVLH